MAGFRNIIGHEQIIDHLQNSIRMKKVSHAYILDGEDGAGKKLLASAFAQALQCAQGGTRPAERQAFRNTGKRAETQPAILFT